MMLPSHLLGTLLLGGLVSLAWRPLTPRQWALALAFGVAVDLDHLIQVPAYVATQGIEDLRPSTIMSWGSEWQGFMHTPWALAVVAPALIFSRSLVPAAFWGLHMVQDFVIARHYVDWGSAHEWLVIAALAVAVVVVLGLHHRRHGGGAPIARHFGATFGVLPLSGRK